MNTPLSNPKRQYLCIKKEIDEAIAKVVDSHRFILGKWVEEFEQRLARYFGLRHAIGVASGTDALLLALKALGIGGRDAVVTTALSFTATADTVLLAGGTPVFVDIDPGTFNIDTKRVEKYIREATSSSRSPNSPLPKAIIPVHLYGQSADMVPLLDAAGAHNLYVVEDVAQAFGGEYRGKKLGTLGQIGCFSFFPSKNLGSFGDGGAVITNDDEIAEKVRMLRQHGGKNKYNAEMLGYNSRLDALHAAVLSVKLKYLDEWNERRSRVAALYTRELGDVDGVVAPKTIEGIKHVYNQYTVRCRDRDRLGYFLKERGVETGVYYPIPLHRQELFAKHGKMYGQAPEAEKACREILSLPMDPLQTEAETLYVVKTIKEFYSPSRIKAMIQ